MAAVICCAMSACVQGEEDPASTQQALELPQSLPRAQASPLNEVEVVEDPTAERSASETDNLILASLWRDAQTVALATVVSVDGMELLDREPKMGPTALLTVAPITAGKGVLAERMRVHQVGRPPPPVASTVIAFIAADGTAAIFPAEGNRALRWNKTLGEMASEFGSDR